MAAILLLTPCNGFSETYSTEQITEYRLAAQQGDADARGALERLGEH